MTWDDWLDRLKEAWNNKRWLSVIILISAAAVGCYLSVLGVRALWYQLDQGKIATQASILLDCQMDGRTGKLVDEYGADLPTHVFFLRETIADEENLGPTPLYNEDQNVVEIHRLFHRCTVTNDGAEALTNIKIGFEVQGYVQPTVPYLSFGSPENVRVSSYGFTVAVPHLAPNDSAAVFAIAVAEPLTFYVAPSPPATAVWALSEDSKTIRLDMTDRTRFDMRRSLLMPVQLTKAPWKPNPCTFRGTVTITPNPSGRPGSATIHYPPGCKNYTWSVPVASP